MKSHPQAAVSLMGILFWSCLLAGCDQSDKGTVETLDPDRANAIVHPKPGVREYTPPLSPPIVAAARSQVGKTTGYDPAYVSLDYPGGDVPIETGVCTDVVVRAFRVALGMDLQKLVHEDMKAAFSTYPQEWGLKKPDPNIDHRRVQNLERYFERKGWGIAVTKGKGDYLPGDVVTCLVPQHHIMIVSDRKSGDGVPFVIHNIGGGTQEEDRLFEFPLTGHYRVSTNGLNNRNDHGL